MHAIDSFQPGALPADRVGDDRVGEDRRDAPAAPAGTTPVPAVEEGLAIAKAHFVAMGWRPLAIHPPALDALCGDVSALLLMDAAGRTIWLGTRDWSAIAQPVDAFRREMACIRDAHVDEAILVYPGEFPANVVEAAAHERDLKLIDGVALHAMRAAPAPRAAPRPGRGAPGYLRRGATRALHAMPMPAAAERYLARRMAQSHQALEGERHRLKTLTLASLAVIGAALGFFAFNIAMLAMTPDDDGARVARADALPALPQPLPPPQGYVAQAAGVSGVIRPAPAPQAAAISANGMNAAPMTAPALSAAYEARVQEAGGFAPQDAALQAPSSQPRPGADEAIRVIADDTPEMRLGSGAAAAHSGETRSLAAGTPVAAPLPTRTTTPPAATQTRAPAYVVPPRAAAPQTVDPAMADDRTAPADPAIVE